MRNLLLCLLLPCVAAARDPVAVFGTTVVIPSGLKGDICFLKEDTQTLEDLAHLHPRGYRRADAGGHWSG
jgi:hypothetical protein